MSPFADLTGQSALVTGAGSAGGIGFACAVLLGRLGAKVAISSTTERIHDRVAELVALGIDAFGVAADLTESQEATALVAAVAERRGRMDILVNNAGMTSVSRPEQPAPLQGLSDAAFAEALQRNLATAFYVTRAALARMIPAGYGRIVNLASDAGLQGFAYLGGYAASKFAVVALTQVLALELANTGVTVNAVCPGTAQTAMNQAEWVTQHALTGQTVEAVQASYLADIPAGRFCTPEDVGAAVSFLASSRASFVTGQSWCVNGGTVLH